MRDKINLGIALSVMAVISYYSLKPSSAVNPGTGGMFPVLHFLAYLGLSSVLLLYLHEKNNAVAIAAFSAFLFGLSMELLQTQISGRFFTFKDLAINLSGASAVALDHKIGISTNVIRYEDMTIEKLGNWQSI